MIIGKYIRRLLEDRTRVILPGFGNLQVILPEGTMASSGKRLDPPGLRVKFNADYSKDDGLLAETMAAGEVMEREEAQQRVLELVDAIKFALDKGEDFLLPETGSFSRDSDGKVHFHLDPDWVLEPDQYGLESMDLLELEEFPAEEPKTPRTGASGNASQKLTELTPPRPKPKNFRWRVIWLVAAALIVVLVVLILVPSEDKDGRDRRSLFNRQPDREQAEPGDIRTDIPDDQEQGQEQEQVEEEQVVENQQEEPEPEAPQEQLPVEGNKYFIVAGSFSKLKNASDLQDQLNSRGYKAEMMITENRMYRVSVGSYATKDEAEQELSRIKSQPGLESCWLLSN